MADCRRQEIDDDEIGGRCGKDGLVEAMTVAAPYHGGWWQRWPVVQFRSRERNTISVVVVIVIIVIGDGGGGGGVDNCNCERSTTRQWNLSRQWQRRMATICRAHPPLSVAAAVTMTAGKGGRWWARDESQRDDDVRRGRTLMGKGREPVRWRLWLYFRHNC